MERTKEQWQAIGRVLAHGIYPGCYVRDCLGRTGTVPAIDQWEDGCGSPGNHVIALAHDTRNAVLLKGGANPKYGFATVIDPPASLSGKEVSVTIDGKTYAAIIK